MASAINMYFIQIASEHKNVSESEKVTTTTTTSTRVN